MDRYGEDGAPLSGKIGPVGMVSRARLLRSRVDFLEIEPKDNFRGYIGSKCDLLP